MILNCLYHQKNLLKPLFCRLAEMRVEDVLDAPWNKEAKDTIASTLDSPESQETLQSHEAAHAAMERQDGAARMEAGRAVDGAERSVLESSGENSMEQLQDAKIAVMSLMASNLDFKNAVDSLNGAQRIKSQEKVLGQKIDQAAELFLESLSAERKQALAQAPDSFQPTPEENKVFLEKSIQTLRAGVGTIEAADPEEVRLLSNLKLEGGRKIGQLMGEEALEALSMRYNIQLAEGKKDVLLMDGKEVEAKDLGDYFLTPEAKLAYASLSQEGLSKKEKQELQRAFGAELGAATSLRQLDQVLRDSLEQTSSKEGKEMNLGQMIAQIAQLIKMIGDAFDRDDYDTLAQLGKDGLKAPENYAKAKESYEKGLEGQDIDSLLAMHQDPSGEMAEKAFGDLPYRGELAKVIEGRFGKTLDLEKPTLALNEQGKTVINGFRGGEEYDILLRHDEAGQWEFESNTFDAQGNSVPYISALTLPSNSLADLGAAFRQTALS